MNGGNKKTEEQEYRATRGNKGNYSLKKSLVTPVPKVFPPPPNHDIKFGQKNRPTNRTKGSQKNRTKLWTKFLAKKEDNKNRTKIRP